MPKFPARLRLPLFLLAFFLVGIWNLDGPPLWWDEGWTLSVARTVVERGAYARLRNGELVANGLEAAIPVTEMIAFSFRVFGVGLWQGRLPGVLIATVALGLLFLLAHRLYDERIAWGALVAALLIGHSALNPLIQSRQAMAEIPMLAMLLIGYLLLDLAIQRHIALIPLAWLFLAFSAILKAQVLPFLLISLLSGALVAAILRNWRTTGLILSCLILIYPFEILLSRGFYYLAHPPLPSEPLTGLTETVAIVFAPSNRLFALNRWFAYGLPSTCGALLVLWQIWKSRQSASKAEVDRLILRAILAAFILSWTAWFLTLAAGLLRYLEPPVFVGAIFTAVLIYELSDHYNLQGTLKRLAEPLYTKHLSRSSMAAWIATLLVVVAIALATRSFLTDYIFGTNQTAQQVAAFLNQTPPGTRIETYETELHFMLNRPYHWPDDQIHIILNRYMLFGEDTPTGYDPLAANPDYLVVGGFARTTGLYDSILATNAFQLRMTVGEYQVFERVRQ